MKTETLIDLLAGGVAPVPRQAARRRIFFALAVALPVSFAVVDSMLGVRSDLLNSTASLHFWLKLLFPLCIAAAGFWAVERLARPGARVGAAWWGLLAPVVAIWSLGLQQWFAAPVDTRAALLWEATWQTCPFSILAISTPVFVTAIVALKGLGPRLPTRPPAPCLAALAPRSTRCTVRSWERPFWRSGMSLALHWRRWPVLRSAPDCCVGDWL